MNLLSLTRREIPSKQLLKHQALESDTEKVISEPCIISVDGRTEIIYGKFPDEVTDELAWAAHSISYIEGVRDTGLITHSRTFGFCPRIALRLHNFCSVASLASSHPKQHEIICRFGNAFSELYKASAPDYYHRQLDSLKTIRPEWVIPGTPFTSGIVNKNNVLKYHFDGGNFDGVMSCMVVLRKNCEGGFLSIPELNTRFMLTDRSYFLFDGQRILHGVTPIRLTNSKGYRYSVVYYALKAMCRCGSPSDELEYARRGRVSVERRRALPTDGAKP